MLKCRGLQYEYIFIIIIIIMIVNYVNESSWCRNGEAGRYISGIRSGRTFRPVSYESTVFLCVLCVFYWMFEYLDFVIVWFVCVWNSASIFLLHDFVKLVDEFWGTLYL